MSISSRSRLKKLIVLFGVIGTASGQTGDQHVGVSLHEDMINSFFASIGEVSGKGETKGVKYRWTVVDPLVDIEPGSASFSARVKLRAGSFEAVEKANGNVDVQYIIETNTIRVKVQEAKVKLSFKLLGQKIDIGTIDIADYYKPAFEFAGPQPIQKMVEVSLPGGGTRKIQIGSLNENLVLEKDRVAIYSDLGFTPVD